MSDYPKRIQRKRTKGWRMPEGAVYVGRPSKWGNPFVIGEVKLFVNDDDPNDRIAFCPRDAQEVVAAFRWLASQSRHVKTIQKELRGKTLACWCPEGSPCHGDILLEIANRNIDQAEAG